MHNKLLNPKGARLKMKGKKPKLSSDRIRRGSYYFNRLITEHFDRLAEEEIKTIKQAVFMLTK